jgi:hypothetical protein
MVPSHRDGQKGDVVSGGSPPAAEVDICTGSTLHAVDEVRKEVEMEKERKTTYERPTLTLVGPFTITGLGFVRGPERILPLRFSF